MDNYILSIQTGPIYKLFNYLDKFGNKFLEFMNRISYVEPQERNYVVFGRD